jgi:hypothetical protein
MKPRHCKAACGFDKIVTDISALTRRHLKASFMSRDVNWQPIGFLYHICLTHPSGDE